MDPRTLLITSAAAVAGFATLRASVHLQSYLLLLAAMTFLVGGLVVLVQGPPAGAGRTVAQATGRRRDASRV